MVFPTQVGVFLHRNAPLSEQIRLPHAGGGVSQIDGLFVGPKPSSPRRWGCFLKLAGPPSTFEVFPTQVGVFPTHGALGKHGYGLPHAGGGVSRGGYRNRRTRASSPRRWGCFLREYRRVFHRAVFPTQVGVFLVQKYFPLVLVSLPHAGGGVSSPILGDIGKKLSSPRRWGCFQKSLRHDKPERVFPTQVGVFP